MPYTVIIKLEMKISQAGNQLKTYEDKYKIVKK